MMTTRQNITIIGAGLMGHGIALVFARAGHSVILTDPVEAARNTVLHRIAASMSSLGETKDDISKYVQNISVCEHIADAVQSADIIFEAAPEKLALKQKIFAEIELNAPDTCILASNTSVMPITDIMSELRLKNRAIGTHWWNPPHMIPLVEVISTHWTDDSVADQMMAILASVGKTPVQVKKDVPGFIGNRLQHALWREEISLVENGICDASAVDTVIKASFGRRLAVLGPLENADLVGTDLSLDIHENVLFDLESRQGPSPYLKQLVNDGRLGVKSGEGFYTWTEEDVEKMRSRVSEYLTKLEKILPKE
jgi:3-hydroxybutyryl-CoA dehydrogenase